MTAKKIMESNTYDRLVILTCDEFKKFCDQLCREQREICARDEDKNVWIDETVNPREVFVRTDDVLNAPMPEI